MRLSNGKVLAIAILFLFVVMMLNIKIIGEPKAYISYNHPSTLLVFSGIGYFFIFSGSPLGFLNVSFRESKQHFELGHSLINNMDQSSAPLWVTNEIAISPSDAVATAMEYAYPAIWNVDNFQ